MKRNLTPAAGFTRGILSKALLSGICEIHYINSIGEQEDIACTLRKFHMDKSKEKDWVDLEFNENDIVIWSMRDISWKVIPVERIVSFEQLTGVPKV
jgi:hypothetical protein